MEMQGRTREGLAFLAATESAWGEGTGFSVHLAWHQALFHLDAVDPHSALTVYDAQIAKPGASDMSVLADASALLWRLQLRNIEVGGRWRLLADRWEMHSFAGVRPFYAVHAMMAFAAAGRTAAAARVFEALPHTDSKQRLAVASAGGACGAVLRSAARLRPQRLCGVRRMAGARAPHRGSLRRQPRTVRPHPSHVHRGGIARAKGASCPRAGGGARSTETSEPAQSAAAAAPGADNAWDA